jgi:hypothetical protein
MLTIVGLVGVLIGSIPDTLDFFHSSNIAIVIFPILGWWVPGLLSLWFATKLLRSLLPKPEK